MLVTRGEKQSLWVFAAALALLSAVSVAAKYAPVMVNHSNCLAPGVYETHAPVLPLKRNSLVSFCPPLNNPVIAFGYRRGWLLKSQNSICEKHILPYMKEVGAIAGDTVAIKADGVYVNGAAISRSKVLHETAGGAPMPHLPLGSFIVPAGQFFAIATYDKFAFDSRYYGLVSNSLITNSLTPLLVRGGDHD